MEKEFEEYWSAHSKRMLLNAPRNLRQEYLDSTKLDTPKDSTSSLILLFIISIYYCSLAFHAMHRQRYNIYPYPPNNYRQTTNN